MVSLPFKLSSPRALHFSVHLRSKPPCQDGAPQPARQGPSVAGMRPRASASWLTNDLVPSITRHLLDVRGTVQLLRLVALGVVYWYERLVFLYASIECSPWTGRGIGDATQVSVQTGAKASRPQDRPNLVVSVLADPQLIDYNTYDYMRHLPWPLSSSVYSVARWAADTYVRKSFHAVVRTTGSARSDAVIWLGDLLDQGRAALASASDVEQYERAVHRFRGLFAEKLPTLYLAGNHDIRIPLTRNPVFEKESRDSRTRWLQEWGTWHDSQGRPAWSRDGGREHLLLRPQGGPSAVKVSDSGRGEMAIGESSKNMLENVQNLRTINVKMSIFLDETRKNPTHELILVDALDLAGMLPATLGDRSTYIWQKQAKEQFRQTFDFVESLGLAPNSSGTNIEDISMQQSNAGDIAAPLRVLFSHIPLHRPTGTNCNARNANHGVLRESFGLIEQGVDQYASYQNLVAQPVTDWLLDKTAPHIILSGDNHDHCEIQHEIPSISGKTATELSVKAFGITGGVRRPGFARVGLWLDPHTNAARAAAIPCNLPDQVSIWMAWYPLAVFCLVLVLMIDRRWRILSGLDRKYRDATAAWQITLSSRMGPTVPESDVRGIDDEEWQLIEQGDRSVSFNADDDASSDPDESDTSFAANRSRGQNASSSASSTLQTPNARRATLQSPASPSHTNRIRFSRASTIALHATPARIGSTPRGHSSFESRALRELKFAAVAGEAVIIRSGPMAEVSKAMLLPLLFWLWLQVF